MTPADQPETPGGPDHRHYRPIPSAAESAPPSVLAPPAPAADPGDTSTARRPGHSKLVFDKASRSIVAVDPNASEPAAVPVSGSAFVEWTCTFPGKMGLSWKRAWDGVGTRQEAEAQAVKNCNVVAVPVQLFERMKEYEKRMVEAEAKLYRPKAADPGDGEDAELRRIVGRLSQKDYRDWDPQWPRDKETALAALPGVLDRLAVAEARAREAVNGWNATAVTRDSLQERIIHQNKEVEFASRSERALRVVHDEMLGKWKSDRAERDTFAARVREVEGERDKLAAFKSWVHDYLDAHGVPHHPPGTHGAAGCRIGDRMDWLMADRETTADKLSDVWIHLDGYARGEPFIPEMAAAILRHQQAPGWKAGTHAGFGELGI